MNYNVGTINGLAAGDAGAQRRLACSTVAAGFKPKPNGGRGEERGCGYACGATNGNGRGGRNNAHYIVRNTYIHLASRGIQPAIELKGLRHAPDTD